jgi:hypothetical protein
MRRFIWIISTICCISFLILFACRKSLSPSTKDYPFNAKEAKEWYYGYFKKTSDYASYNSFLLGKKLPDWQHALYKKIGSFEIVEFPLDQAKHRVPITENQLLSENDKTRIVEASISKIVFIKNSSGKIFIRQFQFIPNKEYLQSHNYQINASSFINMDKSFSGSLIISKWDESLLVRKELQDGKVYAQSKSLPHNMNSQRSCNGILVTEWEQDCEVHIYGDGMITEDCWAWTPTGNQWCFDEDPPSACETNPSQQSCFCEIIGGCEEGGGGNTGENCDGIQESLEGTSVSEMESITTTNANPTTRTKNYVWTIYRQIWGLWSFQSHETGIQVKVGNEWHWLSLSHDNISRVGFQIGGNVSCTLNSATPTIGIYNASMTLDYNIEASLVCGGSPFSNNGNYKSSKYINVNE